MDASDRITFEDVLAWMHCPKAAGSGYRPEWPLGDRDVGAQVLPQFVRGEKETALRKIVSGYEEAMEWLVTTKFAVLRDSQAHPTVPPRPDGSSHWTQLDTKHKGYCSIELITGEAKVAFVLPYLHRPHSVYEVVYVDTRPTPMSTSQWSDFTVLASYHRALFREMTGEPLYARYLAPAHQTEHELQIPHTDIKGLLNMAELGPLTDTIRPGAHCESTTETGDGNVRYACPLRESGACNPFQSHHGSSEF